MRGVSLQTIREMKYFDGPSPTYMPMNLEMETGATWSSFKEDDNEHATWRKGPLLRTPKQSFYNSSISKHQCNMQHVKKITEDQIYFWLFWVIFYLKIRSGKNYRLTNPSPVEYVAQIVVSLETVQSVY